MSEIEPNNAFSLLKISVDLDEFYFIFKFLDSKFTVGVEISARAELVL